MRYLKLANPHVLHAMSPAGMEPAGAERHGRSPVGVSFREKASQSNLRFALPLSWPTFWHIASCPRRESNPHLSSPSRIELRSLVILANQNTIDMDECSDYVLSLCQALRWIHV